MTNALLGGILAVLLLAGGAHVWRASRRETAIAIPHDYRPLAEELLRLAATRPPAIAPVVNEPKHVIQFVSGSGRRIVGTTLIPARTRRPNMAFNAMDCPELLSRFVADRQEPNGVWIYRRVSVDLAPGAQHHG